MHITVVIFDDDPHSTARLRTLVPRRLPEGVTATILEASTQDKLEAILASGTQINILLADIQMPEGQPSGIEVVRSLFPPESGTQVIYVSGYLKMALEVYTTSHLYFLIKPIDQTKLSDALAQACDALAHRTLATLRIKCGHRDQLINIASITYLESNLRKVTVHTRSESYETYAKLDDLAEQLPATFTRCHRSYLVNLARVRTHDEETLTLHDGTAIPVSRRRAKQVQHDLLAYLSKSR